MVCDRLGLDPDDVRYVQGDTDKVFYGEGTGGSRSADHGRLGVSSGLGKDRRQGAAIAAHLLKADANRLNFSEGVFSSKATNRTLTIKEIAAAAFDPAKLPNGMEAGPCRQRRL